MKVMKARSPTFTGVAEAVPPHAWFGVSAVFHYLGPSFAVLLFPAVGVLGVAWMRIATAALVFAPGRSRGARSGAPGRASGPCSSGSAPASRS